MKTTVIYTINDIIKSNLFIIYQFILPTVVVIVGGRLLMGVSKNKPNRNKIFRILGVIMITLGVISLIFWILLILMSFYNFYYTNPSSYPYLKPV